jgi:hypothetical protein
LVDIDRITKSGLNIRTCRDEDRKANEESDTMHRMTLHHYDLTKAMIRVAAGDKPNSL